jgi:hypothetical protein
MSAPVLDSNPPRGHFGVWQRLLRGYGPLAVFALMILLLSVLVPSKVQDDDVATRNGGGSGAGSGGGAAAATVPTFSVSLTGGPPGGTYTLQAKVGTDTQSRPCPTSAPTR